MQLGLCIELLRLLCFLLVAEDMTEIRFPCIYCGKELSSSSLVRNSKCRRGGVS